MATRNFKLCMWLTFVVALNFSWASLVAQTVKNLRAMQETRVRSPEERNGKPLQYSCWRIPMGGGDWRATVHEVAESDTTEQLILHFS